MLVVVALKVANEVCEVGKSLSAASCILVAADDQAWEWGVHG